MHEFFANHFYFLCAFIVAMGFLASFIDAIAGGGGLISLPALSMTGLPITSVLGTNKLQASIGTAVAVFKYYKSGLINFRTVFRGLVAGFIGACFGSLMVLVIDSEFMNFVVPILLVLVFVFSLFNKNLGIEVGKKRMSEPMFFSLFGFFLGAYDGFFGPGTGNFWIISIVYFLGYTFLQASGYAKVLNLKSNLFSLMVFALAGHVNIFYGLIMAVGSFFGGMAGSKMVILKGSKLVRPIFMCVVGATILMFIISKI
ncbi:TSUP family transporter [Francisellaceae bacterium CB52]